MTSKNVTWFCEPDAKLRLTGSTEKISDHVYVLFPISLVSLLTGFFHLLLQPLGVQVTFVSQMLVSSYKYLSLIPRYLSSSYIIL